MDIARKTYAVRSLSSGRFATSVPATLPEKLRIIAPLRPAAYRYRWHRYADANQEPGNGHDPASIEDPSRIGDLVLLLRRNGRTTSSAHDRSRLRECSFWRKRSALGNEVMTECHLRAERVIFWT